MRPMRAALLLGLIVLAPAPLRAHGFQPGLLRVAGVEQGSYRLFWLRPRGAEAPADWQLVADPACTQRVTHSAETLDGDAQWIALTCTTAQPWIGIHGLSASSGEVVVQRPEPGATQLLRTDDERVALGTGLSAASSWQEYVAAGFWHILAGWDHLAFVLLLMLVVSGTGAMVGAISAFTVAHSLTLALAALQLVQLPQAAMEALIALSVAALAADAVLRQSGTDTVTQRYPAIAAACFGLLHGTGFAAALRELGFGRDALLTSLVSFNAGVEMGQLVFVLAAVPVLRTVNRLWPAAPLWTARALGVAAGSAFALRGLLSLGWS